MTIFHFRSTGTPGHTLVFPLLVTSVMSIIRYSTVISAKCFLLHNNYCFCWFFLCIFISVTSYDAEQRLNCIEQEKDEEHTSLLSLAVVLSPFPVELTQRLQLHRLNLELDLQSLFGLLCTAVLIQGRYGSAKIDDISL